MRVQACACAAAGVRAHVPVAGHVDGKRQLRLSRCNACTTPARKLCSARVFASARRCMLRQGAIFTASRLSPLGLHVLSLGRSFASFNRSVAKDRNSISGASHAPVSSGMAFDQLLRPTLDRHQAALPLLVFACSVLLYRAEGEMQPHQHRRTPPHLGGSCICHVLRARE